MKVFRKALVAAALLLTATLTASAADNGTTKPIYIFGFSASFNDSTVYFTDIQYMDLAWIEKKTKFLLGRENFSYQLRDYLSESKSDPHRTCMVFYAFSKKNINKKLTNLKKKYIGKDKQTYAIKFITPQEFTFKYVDMSPIEEEVFAPQPEAKNDKKDKKDKKRPEGKGPGGMPPGGMGQGGMGQGRPPMQ